MTQIYHYNVLYYARFRNIITQTHYIILVQPILGVREDEWNTIRLRLIVRSISILLLGGLKAKFNRTKSH